MQETLRRRFARRVLTIPGFILGAVIITATFPIALVVAVALDLLRPQRSKRRRQRCVLLLEGIVLIELAGLAGYLAKWIRYGGRLGGPRGQRSLHQLERWWAGAHRRLFGAVLGLRVEYEGEDLCRPGPVIALGRHTSLADAEIPVWLLANRQGLHLRFTLKHDLLLGPCFDLVGCRIPNYFINRDADDPAAELDAIRRLARGVTPNEALVIFPEGTFPTEARRQRAIERLRERDPGRVPVCEQMQHLLPVRPGGTLALLEGAPGADVLIIGHVGFEAFASLKQTFRALPFEAPVRVRTRRIARAEVPDTADAQVAWLDRQWLELDGWVAEEMRAG